MHKAIVATGSQYMLEVFCNILPRDPDNIGKDNKPNPLQINKDKFVPANADDKVGPFVEIPLPMQTRQCDGKSLDTDINRILKYIYSNQDFSVIKDELNEQNMPSFYSQAYTLKCVRLLEDIDQMIISELLNPGNAFMFYLESIYFGSESVARACEMII